MPSATLTSPPASLASRKALKAAAVFWFAIMLVGQLLFAAAVALTYGAPALRGDFSRWNRGTPHGYVAGEHFANAVVGIHVFSAVLIILSGTLQLIPMLRSRFPRFHRWNGRIYMVVAFAISLAGVYMLLGRGTVGTFAQHIAQLLDAALIMAFAVVAWRTAIARNFATHRRWALRLYLVVSASLFIRAATFLAIVLPGGPYINVATFSGPMLLVIGYGQYLVPLALLELYLRAQTGKSAALRFATAATLFVATAGLGLGIAATVGGSWVPRVRAALDPRISIADTLSATIAAHGTDAAMEQYRQLKATAPKTYDFDERELNDLGYQLLRKGQFAAAIRILQLNVDNFPHSSNVYDSLGEAYADAGDTLHAIANYGRSLELNPKNSGAMLMLKKLRSP
jgi:uncharacterized membrane protein